jgi:hypothetical protein
MDGLMTDAEDILARAKRDFEKCQDGENHNRREALDDIRFARLSEQWPDEVIKQREIDRRPCLTINKTLAFIRQVVNDSRQNKPSIKVLPADSGADKETAQVINGLIRNIEYASNADVAYDTAVECAVTGGFGYFRVDMDYAFDDAFDMDLAIGRISNPFSVYGDPNSTAADSSDWNVAFVVERVPRDEFKYRYGDKANVDFDSAAWEGIDDAWLDDDSVLIAEYWTREEVEKEIVRLSDGGVYSVDALENDPDLQSIAIMLAAGQLIEQARRTTKSHVVKQYILSGVEILEENDWPGRYIPIVPVYGDEFDVEGKRYYRSLIHAAKDAQRMVNYWRSTATELVALAPRVPYIGPKGAFDSDIDRWNTANTQSHPFLEFDSTDAEGNPLSMAPSRQPLDSGVAAGALQEALNASDDMKAIMGLYDASLGARSNETSGRAIMARQREGDVATYHFLDNLTRAIRHAGRILIDLIPKVYDAPRIVRVLGEDDQDAAVPINQEYEAQNEQGEAIVRMHDLTAGKYDLTVKAGPSFTTRREEAAERMTEIIRAFPQAAPVIADIMARNFDWPGADEIADRLAQLNPANRQGLPPQVQEQIQQGMQRIQELERENEQLKADKSIKAYEAQTKRKKVEGDLAIDQLETGVNVLEKLTVPPAMPQSPR